LPLTEQLAQILGGTNGVASLMHYMTRLNLDAGERLVVRGDAADAIFRALVNAETVGRSYLIGTERASTRAYFELIGELAEVPVPRWNLPERALLPVAKVLERVARWTGRRPALPVDILKTTAAGSLVFDGSRAEEELEMRYTPLREALREAVEEIQSEA